MTITHKKAAQILKHWNLGGETIADIYYEGTGNKNDSACYVGEEYVLKYTANPGKLMKFQYDSKNGTRLDSRMMYFMKDAEQWTIQLNAQADDEEAKATADAMLASVK